jgi:hypothetical protein
MKTQNRKNNRTPLFSLQAVGILLIASFGIGCADWHEFGHGPTNPHNTYSPGPVSGITTLTNLAHPVAGSNHGSEVGVLTDSSGDYYVTSYSPEIHVYDPSGTYQATYTLPVSDGSRAVPYVVNDFMKRKSMIFAGAEGGGFYAIEVDKTTSPYTMTLSDSISSAVVGTSESSPKRADDGNFYLAGQWGDIMVFNYDFPSATLTLLSTYSVGEVITGAIALYDIDPAYPDEEVLVATKEGGFYVLDHTLTGVIWSETTGLVNADEYYSGVTVAERGSADPLALLPIAGRIESPPSANSGILRAINLNTQSIEWELIPSSTNPGTHEIPGSVSLMHEFSATGTPTTTTTTTTTTGGTVSTTVNTGDLTVGGDIGGGGLTITVNTGTDTVTDDSSQTTNPNETHRHHSYMATFASTDEHLYAVDLMSGLEAWSYWMKAPGFDAPVTDRSNFVFVGDGTSTLHAVHGPTGSPLWADPVISVGGTEDIVKLGLSYSKELIAGSGNSAYSLLP